MGSESSAEIVVALSKGKLVLLLLGAIAFVAGGVWMWSIADDQTRNNALYVKAVAIACISFFGLCGIYGCIKVFDTRPGLVIDDQGIVDRSSAAAAGRILWSEVVGLNFSELAGQRFITILVVDPRKFEARGNALTRLLNAANTKMLGSPINISPNSLRVSFKELHDALTAAFAKHKAAARTSEESGRPR